MAVAMLPSVQTPDLRVEEAWRDRLLKVLHERRPLIDLCEAYYNGDHPLPEPPQSMSAANFAEARRSFLNLSRSGITNYVSLVPDAPNDRLAVTGFRFGESFEGDSDVWVIWQANDLDADSPLVHHSALTVGNAFEMVWPDAAGEPLITVEHAAQAVVAYVPGSRRRRAAGLKSWSEDDGSQRAVLYLPDKVYKWTQKKNATTWDEWRPAGDDSWPIANPLGQVPLVEFRANPSLRPALFGGGRSEFAGVLPIQDRINKTIFDRLVTAEFQAFRQRWATGWTPADTNQALQMGTRRLLSFPDKDVKVGEFGQADFAGFISAVDADVQSMAAITRTPTFYTLGTIANIAADTLLALQSGLVAKTERHRDNFGESHEEVLRLALAIKRDPRAGDMQSMTLWRDIEHVTWAEKADALAKMAAIGVPREALWSMVPGVTPQDLVRWKELAIEQAKEAILIAAAVERVTVTEPGPSAPAPVPTQPA